MSKRPTYDEVVAQIIEKLLEPMVEAADSGFRFGFMLEEDGDDSKDWILHCFLGPRNLERVGGARDGAQGFDSLMCRVDLAFDQLQSRERLPKSCYFVSDDHLYKQQICQLSGDYQGWWVEIAILSCPFDDNPDVLLHEDGTFEEVERDDDDAG
jgi:hypothetical protein